ncbi:MAG TPA: pantoate--beta-alanine ligase [Streptosporangiaceae bacterium]|nr:pantoate--beta-alanine ligase [Streptosporangiaceae bacterium]
MVARTKRGLAAARATLRPPVVLVPTMGALHDGHQALLRRARQITGHNGSLVVSVFVNPLQFGAGEDLGRYPRTIERDLAVCAQEGVRLVFAPASEEMYPGGQMVTVSPGAIGLVLEGASRPGFFDGMLTVVLKLFNLVRPDVAVFGEKDAQQLALVRRMVADVNLSVEIASVPTVREPDGLASSSRNAYLSGPERATALALSRALAAGRSAAAGGPCAALAAARAELTAAARSEPPLALDYLSLADPVTFAEVGAEYSGEALLLVAGRVGGTRLIDNATLTFGAGPDQPGEHGKREPA